MNPLTNIGISLLLYQCCLKKLSSPPCFNCSWRLAFNWESRQSRCRGDHVIQRVRIMTRWCRHMLWWDIILTRRVHRMWLSRRSSPRRGSCLVYPWRVTGPCTRCVEEVPRLVNRRQTTPVPSPHDFVRSILIQRELEGISLDPLCLSIQSSSLRSHPRVLSRQIFLGLSYLISQFCDFRVMLNLICRVYLYR